MHSDENILYLLEETDCFDARLRRYGKVLGSSGRVGEYSFAQELPARSQESIFPCLRNIDFASIFLIVISLMNSLFTSISPRTYLLLLPFSQAYRNNPGIHSDVPKQFYQSPGNHR